MYAEPIATPEPGGSEHEERRVVLEGVPWAAYVTLRDALPTVGPRLTYLKGRLEIMSPSRGHEVSKKQIARLLELFCLERDIPLFGYGSMTMREERVERGLEPDECYARGADKDRPDLAIEVVVTKELVNKLEVYRGLGIQEVWRFKEGTFTVFSLRGDTYEPIESSEVLPEVDLDDLARFAKEADQHQALRDFRAFVRKSP